jgi:site-specific DNA-cytosine methylase
MKPLQKFKLVDYFCGSGGSGSGLLEAVEAVGRQPVGTFINHWDRAINTHALNYPEHRHFNCAVEDLDLKKLFPESDIRFLWASPSCVFYSRARGAKPVKNQMRASAFCVVKFLRQFKPEAGAIENVPEFCFPEDTMVHTSRGVIPINEVKVGDMVLTHKARWRKVLHTSSKKSNTVYLKGLGHSKFECTPNHKLYLRKVKPVQKGSNNHRKGLGPPEWKRADESVQESTHSTYERKYRGYNWASPYSIHPAESHKTLRSHNNKYFWILVGQWLGDGYFRTNGKRVTGLRIAANKKKSGMLERLFNSAQVPFHKEEDRDNVNVYFFGDEDLAVWFFEKCGKGASDKFIPPELFGAEQELRIALVEGYSRSDTHLHHQDCRYRASTVSKKLAIGLKTLITSLGIPCGIGVPYIRPDARFKTQKQPYLVNWKDTNTKRAVIDDKHMWRFVQEIHPGRENVTVYDITVEEDHSFVADGIVVHNCDWGRLRQKRDPETNQRIWLREVPHPTKRNQTKQVATTMVPFKKKRGERHRSYRLRMEIAGWTEALEPDPKFKGGMFRKWESHMRREGYTLEYRIIRCCDYGDPTTRRRLFVRFVRIDSGLKIVWPNQTHFEPDEKGEIPEKARKWVTAREIINWSNPGNSIFTRPRPLAKNTLRRIAIGLARYGIKGLSERVGFILSQQAGGQPVRDPDVPIGPIATKGAEAVVQACFGVPSKSGGPRSVDEPVQTLTCESRGERVISPSVVRMKGQSHAEDPDKPLSSQTAMQSHYAQSATVVRMKGTSTAENVNKPLSTVTTKQSQAACQAIIKMRGTNNTQDTEVSLHTVSAGGLHYAIMQAFLYAVDLQDEEEQILSRAWGKNWRKEYDIGEQEKESSEPNWIPVGGGTPEETGRSERPEGEKAGEGVGELRSGPVEKAGPNPPDSKSGAVVEVSHGGNTPRRAHDPDKPFKTLTAKGNKGLAQFGIAIDHTGSQSGGVVDPDTPLSTQTTKQRHGAAEGSLTPLYGEEECTTLPGGRSSGIAKPYLVQFYSNGQQKPVDEPLATVTAKGRHSVVYPMVVVDGQVFLVDVKFRMLDIPELAAAQGFRSDYKFTGNKTEQVRQIGNAVPRNTARSIMLAHLTQKEDITEFIHEDKIEEKSTDGGLQRAG